MEEQIVNWVIDVFQFLGWPGVIFLMAAETVFTPIPSEIIMPFAGWSLVRDVGLNVWYVIPAGLIGAVGSTIGSCIIYWIARLGGRPLVEKFGRYVFISSDDINRSEKWFTMHGRWVISLAHLIPQVRSIISVPAGVVKMRFVTFVFFTFLGAFVWCTFLSWGGYLLGDHYEKIADAMRPFVIPIVAIIATLIVFYILWRWRAKRAKRAEQADTEELE